MFKMILLVCATNVSPAECGLDTAIDIIQGPTTQSAAVCAFQGFIQVAATVLPIRPGDTYLKVRCTRERPDPAPKIADDRADPPEDIARYSTVSLNGESRSPGQNSSRLEEAMRQMHHWSAAIGRPPSLHNAATVGCCTSVDLQLILAVDVSASIDAEEAALQRSGYINALTSGKVIHAIESGPLGRIALSYVEWGDREHQRVVVGWRLISDHDSALAVADEIARAGRQVWLNTSISGAIDFSVRLFDRSDFASPRRIIDISGDGHSNDGREAFAARDDAIAAGVTINGLPILDDQIVPGGLDRYYADQVIGGPGAFQVVASDFGDFGRAILTKLVLEVAGLTP